MNRIIATTLSISSLIFPPSAIAQATITPASQMQKALFDKRELIAVAASATENENYFLALRVSNNVIELFPSYGTGYLYRGIAQYRLEELEAAKEAFTRAKKLYLTQPKSAKISAQEESEARSGLEVIELHLKLLSSQL